MKDRDILVELIDALRDEDAVCPIEEEVPEGKLLLGTVPKELRGLLALAYRDRQSKKWSIQERNILILALLSEHFEEQIIRAAPKTPGVLFVVQLAKDWAVYLDDSPL